MIWKNELTLPFYLCDYTDSLTLWSLARLFQDAADDHTSHCHMGFHDLMTDGKAWILSRAYYQLFAMPHATQHITLKTWSRRADRLCAMRDTQLLADDGTVLAAATAMWVIMEMDNRSICHMLPGVIAYPTEPQQATKRDKLDKIRLTVMSGPHLEQTLTAQHSAIDHNLHVNNSDYIRWVVDALKTNEDRNLQDRTKISSLEVNYFIETHLGEKVSIYKQTPDNEPSVRQFSIINPRGTAATLIINLC